MNLRLMMLTVFGLGLLRPAPGTWGSLPPIVLAALLLSFTDLWMLQVALVLCGFLFAIACVRFGEEGEAHFGKKDPGSVVADEVAGQCIALLALPWRFGDDAVVFNGALLAIAFLSFRAIDIIKPPPIRGIQSQPGGWGILLDDLLAGVFALAITQAAGRFLLPEMI